MYCLSHDSGYSMSPSGPVTITPPLGSRLLEVYVTQEVYDDLADSELFKSQVRRILGDQFPERYRDGDWVRVDALDRKTLVLAWRD